MDPLTFSSTVLSSGHRSGVVPNLFLRLALCLTISVAAVLPSPSRAEISGNLIIVGNGPEQTTIESLARAFEKANPRAYVDIVWDDHSKPVEMVKAGEAHVAVTGSEDSGLDATQIAWDGIGILVHLSNFTKEVTKEQVADIYSGKVKDQHPTGAYVLGPTSPHLGGACRAPVGSRRLAPYTRKTTCIADCLLPSWPRSWPSSALSLRRRPLQHS